MPSSTASAASWRAAGGRVDIEVAGRPVVAVLPASGRVRFGLVVAEIDRVADVTVQPAAPMLALREAADRSGTAWELVEEAARHAVTDATGRARAWSPSPEMCLVRSFGGAAFPLLGAAFDLGGGRLDEVPRWAEPVLAARSISEGSRAAFGARATRPVRRALVDALRPTPDGVIDLAALALGCMAEPVLEPDRLARVLGSRRVAQPGALRLDPALVRGAGRMLARWGQTRTERVLSQAAARADGVSMLTETLQYAEWLGDSGPTGPLPNDLTHLHDVHRSLLRSPPPPAPPARTRRPRSIRHRVLAPPVALQPIGEVAPLHPPPEIRSLDGSVVGDDELVVPTTAGDLVRWGRLLSNCLGDFAPSVAAGRSVIIGVRRAGRLIAAVELTPGRSIRQFCGRANRAPDRAQVRAVSAFLAERGLIDRSRSENRPWLAPSGGEIATARVDGGAS